MNQEIIKGYNEEKAQITKLIATREFELGVANANGLPSNDREGQIEKLKVRRNEIDNILTGIINNK